MSIAAARARTSFAVRTMREVLRSSLLAQAEPLRGLRVLLYGFSGRGFPGGDGVAEAVDELPAAGVQAVYTHALDPERETKLAEPHDVRIICNTRIGELLRGPVELWKRSARRVLWFWDLRPGSVGAALYGSVDAVALSFNGRWHSPAGDVYEPAQWGRALSCPVYYCPQAAPLREPVDELGAPDVLFVGDLQNGTYHLGRRALVQALGATVLNAKQRPDRLAIEARLPTLYRSAGFSLSTSPLAPGYTSVRSYSILACGGTMLLQRFPGVERLFEHGCDALLFDTAAEANELVERYGADSAARRRVADAGRLLHASRHTVAHRIVSLCREVLGVPGAEFTGWR